MSSQLTEKIQIPTRHGTLWIQYHGTPEDGAMIVEGPASPGKPFVRVHSSCCFSESLSAMNCDCALQLDESLRIIASSGGYVIYLWEEGRGVGIRDKIRAIAIEQAMGADTASAFHKLGFTSDPRDYIKAISALKAIGIGPQIRLATSNPRKVEAFEAAGFEVERVTLEIKRSVTIQEYIGNKVKHLGHYDES